MSGALMLPPTPAAVAAYFAQRRGTLAGFTPDETRHNEWLWLVEVCKLSESEAAAALEAENGGSTSAEVIPVVQSPTPDAKPADSLSSHDGSGLSIAR